MLKQIQQSVFAATATNELRFKTLAELKKMVTTHSYAMAKGGGTSWPGSSLPVAVISTLHYNKLILFDIEKGIIECQSGVTVGQLLEIIVPAGWFLPVSPTSKRCTIGGMVAINTEGKNLHTDGSFHQHLQEVQVMQQSGAIISCSANQHADLFNATCGGKGITGIIVTVRFKLKKIETAYIRQAQLKTSTFEELLQLLEANRHYTYAEAWVDCLNKGKQFGRGVLLLAEHATADELTKVQKENGVLSTALQQQPLPLSSIYTACTGGGWAARVMNTYYYYRNSRKFQNRVVPLESFFYQPDVRLSWKKGYAQRGFVKYQAIIPASRKEGLAAILKKISDTRAEAFYAVVKHHDSGTTAHSGAYSISFDFPVRKDMPAFFKQLDQVTFYHGGTTQLTATAGSVKTGSSLSTRVYKKDKQFDQTLQLFI